MICKEDFSRNLLISSDGRIFKEIKQWEDKNGYKYITHNHKNLAVHRLVAEQFVPGKTENCNVVMHKDDNPSNNHSGNLAWGSYSENNYDAIAHGLRKERISKVRCIETREEFQSARDAATKMFGIPKRGDHILEAVRNQRGKAYGYHWEVISR